MSMVLKNRWFASLVVMVLVAGMLSSCARRRKYENPITKDTAQPDKVLFDKAIADLEKSRFEVARITLQTLMNTYDTSEYLAKAKLAYADSWYREGGTAGLTNAEAEYKDFILFYPTMEEAAEAQKKVCQIHYRQMEKPDRDMLHALRAEEECRTLLVQFPNSKFAPEAQQLLRNIQEVIAEGEFRAGHYYHVKGSYPASANRYQTLTDHYPLYSRADQALWELGEGYSKMGPRFREQAGKSYAKLVRDYPLSPFADDAKKQLQTMEMQVPEADPVAYNRMKYEMENRFKPGMVSNSLGILKRGPETRTAAKSGSPTMTSLRPAIPVSVPTPAAGTGFTGDVSVQQVGDSSALNNLPDARQTPQAGQTGEATAAPAAAEATTAAPAAPVDAPKPVQDGKKPKKEKKPKAPKNESR